jgi:hypothetical protein
METFFPRLEMDAFLFSFFTFSFWCLLFSFAPSFTSLFIFLFSTFGVLVPTFFFHFPDPRREGGKKKVVFLFTFGGVLFLCNFFLLGGIKTAVAYIWSRFM